MFSPNNDVKEDLKKNKPSLVMPIFNSVLAGIFLIIIIIFKIFNNDKISWPLFSFFVLIIIMFCAASWLNSFFMKKQKTKLLNNYEEETEQIVEYMKLRKSFAVFDNNEKVKLRSKANFEDIGLSDYNYDNEKNSFGELDNSKAVISIGIGFMALEVDPNTKTVINLKGLLPKSIWVYKSLKVPQAKKGTVSFSADIDIRNKTYIQTNKQSDTYYDKKTGWICIGNKKNEIVDDVVEVLNNAYVVISNNELKALWVKIDSNQTIL